MKKTFSSFITMLFLLPAFAQVNNPHPVAINQPNPMTENLSLMFKKDCVFMINGKMLMMKDGITVDMPDEVLLLNGDVVLSNGEVKMYDGSTRYLKNDISIDMNGNWEKMESAKK